MHSGSPSIHEAIDVKAQILSAGSLTVLERACYGLDAAHLGAATLTAIARRTRTFRPPNAVRVALLGNVTMPPLPEFLEAAALCSGIEVTTSAGAFDQYAQELLDPQSDLHQFDPQFLVLAFELRQLDADAFFNCSSWSGEKLKRRRRDLLDRITGVVDSALKRTGATCLLFNFPIPANFRMGIADAKSGSSESAFYAKLNLDLAEVFRAVDRVQIIDVESLSAGFGKLKAFDRRMYYLAKVPWHEDFIPTLADEIVQHIEAATGRTRKCLTLDLDNTLWGGVLGEDGPYGVKVGTSDAVSEAYFDFQMRIRGLRDRGIVLAICSKNNPDDVDEMFRLRGDMPLQRTDFAAVSIGWEAKHFGIAEIAKTLNIGIDSILFVDDNPVEIDLIKQMIPETGTLLLPADPAGYCQALDNVHGLQKVRVSSDDARKSESYQEQAQRTNIKEQFADLAGYLNSLQTRFRIRDAGKQDVKRVHELFTKTNQFNATTRRYGNAEIEHFLASNKHDLMVFDVKDRYGDLGTIGVCLVDKQEPGVAEIENFVMSCRAIGRGIETAAMIQIKARYFDVETFSGIKATFVPSKKNKPIRDFFPKHGFSESHTTASGTIHYRLGVHESSELACDWISIEKGFDK